MRILARWQSLLRTAFMCLVFSVVSISGGVAHAQSAGNDPIDVFPGDTPAGQLPPTPAAGSGAGGLVSATPKEFTKGNESAITQLTTTFQSLIPMAVTISHSIAQESDKLAWGLGVITLVLAGVRFAATPNATAAWTDFFEELTILSIFGALYLGYDIVAPGFWNWFVLLADKISNGAANPAFALVKLAGTIFDATIARAGAAKWYEYGEALPVLVLMLATVLIMVVTALVFCFYTMLGQIQSAFGIVVGPIAMALGFSSYTRAFFKSWLDYMISAGMYVVVAAALVRLVGVSITSGFEGVSAVGGSTVGAAAYSFDLAIFTLLIAFEIPKMAAIFGGGANASGSAVGKAGRLALKAVGF